MPFLVVGGVTVKVVLPSGTREERSVGEVRPAFSGAPRSSVRAYFAEWEVETNWLARSAADTLRAALKGTPPVACSGDLTGSINCYVQNIREVEKGRKIIGGAAVEAVRLGFKLMAAA